MAENFTSHNLLPAIGGSRPSSGQLQALSVQLKPARRPLHQGNRSRTSDPGAESWTGSTGLPPHLVSPSWQALSSGVRSSLLSSVGPASSPPTTSGYSPAHQPGAAWGHLLQGVGLAEGAGLHRLLGHAALVGAGTP